MRIVAQHDSRTPGDRPPAPGDPPVVAPRAEGSPLEILVLEDQPDDADLLERQIRRTWPDSSVRVVDRRAAFEAALEPPVDLILADFSLVDFDALAALRLLAERGLDVPVIVVTGAVGEEKAAECIREGASDYLLKDRLVRLPTAIESALEKKRLRDDRRRAAEALERSERYYRKLIREALDVMVIVNADGTIRYHSPSAEALLGYRTEELDGRPISDFVHEEDEAALEEIRRAIRRRRDRTFEAELRVRTRSGEWRTYEVRGRSLLADPDVGGVLLSARDVTERKRAEADLATRATELARSNAELEQFAYVASHDLQEPLRMVASYTELLARRYRSRLDADADEFIGYATEGVARMRLLIDDLLAYTSVSRRAEELTRTDVESVLAEALANLSRAIEDGGARVTSDALPTILGDRSQLLKLFQNLIGNAIKFHGRDPARVHVTAALVEPGLWKFSVSDNGIGIDPQFQDRIFVLFQRLHTRDKYPGTGIGLTICKKVVERHGGRIWVEPNGAGSTFHFTLRDRS